MVEVVVVEVVVDDDETLGIIAVDDTSVPVPDDDLSGVDGNISVTVADNDGTSVTAADNDTTSVTVADNDDTSLTVASNDGFFVVDDVETGVAIDADSTVVLDNNTGVVLINDDTDTVVVDRTYILDDDGEGDGACPIVNDDLFVASDDFGIIEVELTINIASVIDTRLNNNIATCFNIIFLTICFPNLQ